jgi:hypothetical protein
MKINNSTIIDSFFKGINKDSKFKIEINNLESTLNIPNKMLSELIEDEGWLFIIKCNSLIEISLNTSIIKTLNQPK